MKLQNKKALITGGSRGIGKGIAEAYAKEGADVVINYNSSEQEAIQLKEHIESHYNVAVHVKKANVVNEEEVNALIDYALEKMGRVDILVNSAGILEQCPATELTTKQWDRMIDINLKGPFLTIKAVLPHMVQNKFGRIINISSQLGQIGGVEVAHYTASKAGLIGMTKSLARELGVHGITANCIAPGPIETDMISHLDEEWKKNKEAELAVPRFGRVEEVTPTAVLLASDPDGNIYTGQTLGPNSGDVML